ncbi:MAG: group III truncated hemoglobin [Bacteroidota bacterium]
MKRDIQNRADIKQLIQYFYTQLLEDKEMHHLFIDIAQIDLPAHLPILCDFWEGVLFHTNTYRRNTMQKHLDLHQKYPLTKAHFDYWLGLFKASVDELFIGEKAELAKTRALSIATVMQIKIHQLDSNSLL